MAITVTTPELQVGMVVRHPVLGPLHLTTELVRRADDNGHGELVAFVGEVIDDDGLAERDPYAYRLAVAERDYRVKYNLPMPESTCPIWVVQGNSLATWSME